MTAADDDAWVGWHDEPDDDDTENDGPDGAGRDDEGERDEQHRRNRRVALTGLAVVVVIIVATLLLVQLVDTSSGAPRGPVDAARQWGLAVVHGATGRERRLECSGSELGRTLRPLVSDTGEVTADAAIKDGPAHWRVPLHLPGLGGRTVLVPVRRQDNGYVVC